ncbi:MAG: hypothetical protein IPH62_19605 [Ignavibacteriae bacterium]|nr:hypothetical protein [Ignavibacteriota bacterium]
MDRMLESVANLPWPMFLLIIVLFVVVFVYFQVLLPSIKEIDILRTIINTKLINIEQNINTIDKTLSNIQTNLINNSTIYIEKISDMESDFNSLRLNLEKNNNSNEKILDRMSDIKERLFIIQNSRISDEYRGVK